MGVKASIIVDATGIPLGVNIAPGSWNDMKLAAQPAITVPAVTLDGLADGNFPATDGSTSARHFTGPRVHHQVPNAGHNLPQEAPDAFASAVLELAHLDHNPPECDAPDSAEAHTLEFILLEMFIPI